MLPMLTDYSFGGGPIGHPDDDDGSMYYHGYTCEQLAEYLESRDIAYICLQKTDERFRREYGPLFADDFAAALTENVRLYVRLPQAEGVLFAPCTEGLSWEEICNAYGE